MKLIEKILLFGKENIIFMVPLNSLWYNTGILETDSNGYAKLPCYIVEERYKLSENYKIELKPFNSYFSKKSLYITDLESLIEENRINLYIKEEF